MMDQACDLSNAMPVELAHLLDVIAGHSHHDSLAWREADYADVFSHLLRSPLLITIEELDDPSWQEQTDASNANFGALESEIFSQSPNPKVMGLIKRFAKHEFQAGSEHLPKPVSLALYYLVICRALVGANQRITELSDQQLVSGIDWVLQQTWIIGRVRQAFKAAKAQLVMETETETS